jgi:hypothetical protein
MDIESICTWLKSSIPGIVLLGALGSIVAYMLLKVCAWLIKKPLRGLIIKVFTPIFRSMVVAKLVADQLDRQSSARAKAHFISLAALFCASTVVFLTFLGLTVMYFIVRGPVLGFGIYVLIVLSFLTLYAWLTDLAAFFGAGEIYIGKETERMEHHYEKGHSLDALSNLEDEVDKRRMEKLTPSNQASEGMPRKLGNPQG